MPVDHGTLSLVLFSFLLSGLFVTTVGAAFVAWRTDDPSVQRTGWALARQSGKLLACLSLGIVGVCLVALTVSWRVTDIVGALELFAPTVALYVVVVAERGVRGFVFG